MGRQAEATAQRLRRLARALSQDSDSADALVVATLTAHEARPVPINRLMATLIGLRRKREDARLQAALPPASRNPGANHGEITRAFALLPLADREVLALVAVEHFAYEDAAAVLDIGLPDFIVRLTRARTSLARVVDGERHVVLRVVK